MKREFLAAIILLLISSVANASSGATLVFTFACTGKTVGPCPNGSNPNSLIQGSDGNLYGTTAISGTASNGQYIVGGTVFSLTPTGKFTLLHTFTGGTNNTFANGATPLSLTEGPDGKLYGLTAAGGNVNPNFGGVAFRLNKNGTGFQVIHRFCSAGPSCPDGVNTAGMLVVAPDGNLYGTTSQGGTGAGCSSGCGTVFRIIPATGTYQVAANFTSADFFGFPTGLIKANDGTFYGVTVNGNMLFHFSPATGALKSTRLAFPLAPGCPGLSCFAVNSVSLGSNGNLYGFYGVYGSPGVAGIFEVQPDGSHFHLFTPYTRTSNPGTELLLASDGNFWSPLNPTASGEVVAFLPSSGQLVRTLTPFNTSVFGPVELIQAKNGSLWGVGAGGVVTSGQYAGGSVFTINAGLPVP